MPLSQDLSLLSRLFDLEKIAQEKPDIKTVHTYYQWTNQFYRYFHSAEGAMHFPLYLPERATNHFEGLAEQANFIQDQTHLLEAQAIAEIGCGSGFNLRKLAEKNPQKQYHGIDATPLHVRQARRFAKREKLQNVDFQNGTFSSIPLGEASLDIAFAVESFCYSQDLRQDLQEVARTLRKGGRFVIFDVFLQPKYAQSSASLQLASQLTAVGFAVAKWDSITDLCAVCEDLGLEVISCEDLHETLLPNLLRFQKDARRYLTYTTYLSRLLPARFLPTTLLKHTMTGLLAPYAMHPEVQGYFRIVIEKRNSA